MTFFSKLHDIIKLINLDILINIYKKNKAALNENYKKIKQSFKMGEIDTNEFNTFSKLMKESLYKSLNELCKI